MPLYRCDHCRDWRLRSPRSAALHDTAHWYDQLSARLAEFSPVSAVPEQRLPADALPLSA